MKRRKAGKKADNRGMALVLVIVALALVMIMVGVLLSVSLLNYQMKVTEKRAKDNFYSAEVALDQIHAGLSQIVSEAAGYAYTRAMQTYKMDGVTEEQRVTWFRSDYLSKVEDALKAGGGGSRYELGGAAAGEAIGPEGVYEKGLASYLDKYLASKLEGGSMELTSTSGCAMTATSEGLLLKGILVGYTDMDGYYSEIQTDIAVGYPGIELQEASVLPNVFEYSFIADGGLVFNQSVGARFTESVYAGENGVKLTGSRDVSFDGAQYVVSKGKLSVDNTSSLTVQAGSVWLNGIDALGSALAGNGGKSSEIYMDTDIYVSDDLTISGQNASVTLEGNYYGYGGGDSADKQSAMLLNCSNSTLDLTGLDELMLSGNAFISTGAIDYTVNDSLGFASGHNKNVLTGNSLSVKADQIAYLAPAECLGTLDGTTAVGRNPMTAEEYLKWSQELPARYPASGGFDYRLLDEDRTVGVLGKPLSDYFTGTGEHYQTVFRTLNGESICYVYLKMNADEAAAYFRDYAEAARDTLEKYARKYNNNILVNTRFTGITSMGNLMTYRLDGAGTIQVVENTVSETNPDYPELEKRQKELADAYTALCSKLTTNYKGLTEEEISRGDVYLNLIRTDKLAELGNGRREYEAGGYRAVVSNEPEIILNQSRDRIKLVITSGDVLVEGSFSGLIIAGGKIELGASAGAVVSADKESVTRLLAAKYLEPDGAKSLIATYFINGSKYVLEGTDGSESGYVDLEGAVAFRNWSKQ